MNDYKFSVYKELRRKENEKRTKEKRKIMGI